MLTGPADLDIQLLLTIQWACNHAGVKIPWDKVATAMGEKFTEGAIVQHLSKLRLRREADGKAVPPPLRRSVSSAIPKPGPAQKDLGKRKARAMDSSDDDDDSYEVDIKSTIMAADDDEDPDWVGKGHKKRYTPKRIKTASVRATPRSNTRKSKKKGSSTRSKTVENSSSDSNVACAGASFLGFGNEDESGSDDNRSEAVESSDESERGKKGKRVLRLPVPREALLRLQSTGSVAPSTSIDSERTEMTSTNPMFSSPPPIPYWQMNQVRQPVRYQYPSSGPNPYQQPTDLSCIDPALLTQEQYTNMPGWSSAPDYPPQFYAPPQGPMQPQPQPQLVYPPLPDGPRRWGPLSTQTWDYVSGGVVVQEGSHDSNQGGDQIHNQGDGQHDDLAFQREFVNFQGGQSQEAPDGDFRQ